MNNKNPKLKINQEIAKCLLKSNDYNVKNIAELSISSIEPICSICDQNTAPIDFFSESQLVKLYQIILDIHPKKNRCAKYVVEINQVV